MKFNSVLNWQKTWTYWLSYRCDEKTGGGKVINDALAGFVSLGAQASQRFSHKNGDCKSP